ncbi:MAG: hypothetical protein ACREDE_09345 [Thermoplasmata archaeon]
MPPSDLEIAVTFSRAVVAAGGESIVIGSVAVNAYARERSSSDVDFLVLVPERNLPRLAAELGRRRLRLADRPDLADAFREHTPVSVHVEGSLFRVDVKFAAGEEEAQEVRDGVRLDNGLTVPTVEHVVAYKILFGSPQDYLDAQRVIEMNGHEIDEEKLRSVMQRRGTAFSPYRRLKRQAGRHLPPHR